MGYTHYWQLNSSLSSKEFKQLQVDWVVMRRLSNIPVEPEKNLGWMNFFVHESEKLPSVENMAICFNGIGEDAHETFVFQNKDVGLNFCKTAEKPYDELVAAFLLWVTYKHPTYIDVRSDGDVRDWYLACELIKAVMGLDMKISFDSTGTLVIDKVEACENMSRTLARREVEGAFS